MLTGSKPVLNMAAPEFELPATDGKVYTRKEVSGENGTVIAFICNHCPYVIAIIDRLVADAEILSQEGIGFAAICSNDSIAYPEDSFAKMKLFAEKHGFGFPYLHDELQSVASAYDAVCTPDIYGLSSDGIVKYHGRLDEGRIDSPGPSAPRELVEAMRMVAKTGEGPAEQKPSMGCSIKWKS